MGHAHHFLSRLDRLTRPHVELALALYRDDERLRYVLEHARVPADAERVAVSLDDATEGPFVLVTRTGRFVTCLGRGMRADNLPVVTRAELEAISAKHALQKGREAARDRLIEPDGGAAFLLGRLLDAGPNLAREEFQALAALHPLIGEEYLDTAFEWALTSRRIQLKLKPALKKRGTRLWPLQLEQLHLYYKTFFAAGHLAVLSLSDGGELIRRQAAGDDATLARLAKGVAAVVVDGGNLSKTVRGAWALGQLGEAWVPHAARQLATATDGGEVLSGALALLAIGARNEALRPEIVRVFEGVPALANEEAQKWAAYVCECGTKLLADVERVLADHCRTGAALACDFHDYYPDGSPYRYARPEDVPEDIAFSAPFQLSCEFARDQTTLPLAISMVVPAARAEPEQLYLPRRHVEFLEPKWEPEHSLAIMEGWLEAARQPPPPPAEPLRNRPCPCGSGKKYKRCCGATR
jgi:hypothetical protein